MNLWPLVLLTGFFYVSEENRLEHYCYHYVQEKLNFADARVRCQKLGFTDLAVVDSQEKSDLAKKVIQLSNGNNPFDVWMGLTYDVTGETFNWNDGRPLGWSNWHKPSSEPNDMSSDQCVRIKVHSQFMWGTRPCDRKYEALCEDRDMDSAQFVLYAKDKNSADQSLTSFQDVRTRKECSLRCLRQVHCCSYFLYDNTTCVLFPPTPQLDVSIPRRGAVIFRKGSKPSYMSDHSEVQRINTQSINTQSINTHDFR